MKMMPGCSLISQVMEGLVPVCACSGRTRRAISTPLMTKLLATPFVIFSMRNTHAAPLYADTVLLGEPQQQSHPVLFVALNRAVIRQAALHTHGAALPSAMDATTWRRIFTSFRSASDDLCDALVSSARRIYTTYMDPVSIEAYDASWMVPLDKQPDVRPIGQ